MKSNSLKPYFRFSRQQRNGVFVLLSLIVVIQFVLLIDFSESGTPNPEKQLWLAFQSELDSLKKAKAVYVPKRYPFNPNFITDFKGYQLGMSVAEIDRLLEFRKTNKYVNSAKEFQQVTKVSDSLLEAISPYFKFPDWVTHKKSKPFEKYTEKYQPKREQIVVMDINKASKEDLMKVYGIGPALSDRILKEKEKFGGFLTMEQMGEVWGLSDEVIEKLNQHFEVREIPAVTKVDINNATVKELMQFPYFRYSLAREIVAYRSMNGDIKSADDLTKIKGFPVEKIKIIALYLKF